MQKSNLLCSYDTAGSDRHDQPRELSTLTASASGRASSYQPRNTVQASQGWHGIQASSPVDTQNDLPLDWAANLQAAQYVQALLFILSTGVLYNRHRDPQRNLSPYECITLILRAMLTA